MKRTDSAVGRLLAYGYLGAYLIAVVVLQAPFSFSADPAAQEADRSDAHLQTVALQLKWRHQFQFAGYYAAIEKGFYRAAHLEVRLIEGLPETDSVQEVVSGRAEYGVGQAQLLIARAHGNPVVVLAAIFQHSPDVLIARKDSGISSPQDVIGHRIVLGAPGSVAVRAMLSREGVSLDKVTVLENAPNRASLLSGRAAAASGYITDLPYVLDQEGIPNTIINPVNYGLDFYGDCLFTSEKELRNNPERARALREASLKGWEYAMAHPQEVIDLILRKYPSALDRKGLAHEAEVMRSLMLPDLIEIGHMNPGRWRNMADISAELGFIPRDFNLAGFLYEPNPRPNYAWLYWTLGIVSAGLLTFGGGSALLWVHNRQLQKAVRVRTSALRKSEEKFAKAFLVSPVSMAIRRLTDNRYLEANEVFEQRTGYRRDEILGRTPQELGIFEDPRTLENAARLLNTEGRVRNLECHFRSKTGEPLVGLLSHEPIELDGEPCVLAVAAEITELKQKEAEIHRRNRELTLLNKVMTATATEMEPKAVLEVACRELAHAFDLPQACAFIQNEKRSVVTCVAEYAASGRLSMLGRTIAVPDNPAASIFMGEKLPMAVEDVCNDPRLQPFKDILNDRGVCSLLMLPLVIEGETVGGISLSTTERHVFNDDEVSLGRGVAGQVAATLARARLSESRLRLMAAIDQSPESVVITDVQGVIIYVNPAFERITGYSRQETIGRNPSLLKSGKQDAAFYRDLWAKISDGQVWRGRFVNRRKDGTLYTGDAVVAPVRDVQGSIVNYIGIQRDITRELQLEEQYLQAQKMESVGRLAGGVAHDFNNILTVIMGNAELALMDLPPGHALHSALESIQDGAAHAASLTRQLLAFARREVIEPRPIDLNQLITHFQKMLHRLIGEDIRIDMQADPELRQIEADSGQIEQILLNLVVNARDAMPEGGTLTIRTANLDVAESDSQSCPGIPPGEYVQLCVGDTGVGMTEDVRTHIFEPFFTTKEAGKGTGLGLATCFGIVKQNGAYIHFDSEPGFGTTFRITFPGIKTKEPAGVKHEAWPKMPRGSETILLVEDELPLRALVARVLRAQGFMVLEASNGREALSLVTERGTGFNLLLSDVVMPEMSGKTLADQLRSICPEAKVLFVSGYIGTAVVQEALADSGVAFLQKPFNPSDLVKKVRDVLDSQKRRRKA